MVLTPRVVNVEAVDWSEFQKLHPGKASSMFRDWVRNHINYTKGDNSSIDIDLTTRELAEKERILQKTQISVIELRAQLDNYNKVIEERAREQLLKQKSQLEIEEAKTKCKSCLNQIKSPIEFKGSAYQLCINCLRVRVPNVSKEFLVGGGK